jgi:hypothetical protein
MKVQSVVFPQLVMSNEIILYPHLKREISASSPQDFRYYNPRYNPQAQVYKNINTVANDRKEYSLLKLE